MMGRILAYLQAVWGVIRHGVPTVVVAPDWMMAPRWVRVETPEGVAQPNPTPRGQAIHSGLWVWGRPIHPPPSSGLEMRWELKGQQTASPVANTTTPQQWSCVIGPAVRLGDDPLPFQEYKPRSST